jgi:hypothetical protein
MVKFSSLLQKWERSKPVLWGFCIDWAGYLSGDKAAERAAIREINLTLAFHEKYSRIKVMAIENGRDMKEVESTTRTDHDETIRGLLSSDQSRVRVATAIRVPEENAEVSTS